MGKKEITLSPEVAELIKATVNVAYKAGCMTERRATMDTYKATEKRLYAYPDLKDKIIDDGDKINEIQRQGSYRSQSIKRYTRPGMRLSPDEIVGGLVQGLSDQIAADQHEVDIITAALSTIERDAYYPTITGRFFHGCNDVDIADELGCDPTTVRKNRGRLVRKLAVRLYGAQAL